MPVSIIHRTINKTRVVNDIIIVCLKVGTTDVRSMQTRMIVSEDIVCHERVTTCVVVGRSC